LSIGYILVTIAPSQEHESYNNHSKVGEIIELRHLISEYDFIDKAQNSDITVS